MTEKKNSYDSEIKTSGVTIGNVYGGIRNAIIAGRDVIFPGSGVEQRALRNRRDMLQLVWNTWIEGVLKQSLYNEVFIELGMETRPDAVEHPWDMVVQMPDREPVPVPPGITTLELFDQANGSLLILGEPGSGKTTMLLELTREAILRAQESPEQPIPVVFNLSSWTPKLPFDAWLIQELRDKYYVPKKIGRVWLENDDLLLMLDGLDEVHAKHREACAESINSFRAEHSNQLAICSRRREYEALKTHLKLRGAVLIQPLTPGQVRDYMHKAGPSLANVHQVLQDDPDLLELVRTPLMISIFIVAYRDSSIEEIHELEKSGDQRKRLFQVYVQQMFFRRGKNTQYTLERAQGWLRWLARKMKKRGKTQFYIEDIGLDWVSLFKSNPGLIFGLIIGLIFGLVCMLIDGFLSGLIDGLIYGVVNGILAGMMAGLYHSKPTEKLIWSRENARVGLKYGLIIGLITWLLIGLTFGLVIGLTYGLMVLVSVLVGSMMIGAEIEHRTKAGAGIRTSVIYALVIGVISGLISAPIVGQIYGSINGVIYGMLGGVILSLWFGGAFIIAHYTSRLLLYRAGHIPWNLIDFLDYATNLIYMRKVGGGYIFIHRMLMEHFAGMKKSKLHKRKQKKKKAKKTT